MSIHTAKTTRIGTLHVRGATDTSVALRLGLSSLLNSADLRPVGIPPAAILIVRRLADPMPGRVPAQRRAVRVDAAWEKATQNALADLYRRAARPNRGYVPPHAPAVLFADQGEMLAALALDISRGHSRHARHWWWKTVLPTLLPSATPQTSLLVTLLCRQARAVPAVLHHLADWGELFSVAKALDPNQAMSVLSAMTLAHGMGDFSLDLSSRKRGAATFPHKEISHRDVEDAVPKPTEDVVGQQERGKHHRSTNSLAFEKRGTTLAPWARWLPAAQVPQTLAKEQVCLLGVGLSLHHRPAIVSNHLFRHTLRQWWAVARDEFALPEQELAARGEEEQQATDWPSDENGSRIEARWGVARQKAAPDEEGKREQEAIKAAREPDSSRFSLPPREQERTTESKRAVADQIGLPELKKRDCKNHERPTARHSAKAHRAKPQNNATDVAITFTDGGTKERHREPSPSLSTTDVPSPQERLQKSKLQLAEGVVTDLGGLLYLINLMEHLDLPACFENGWQLASQIGPWGLLEVLGRALLGGQSKQFAADPIWQALATLDAREVGQLPGSNFRGHDHFRLPKGWLSQLREREERWYWGKVVTTSVVPDGPERLKSLLRQARLRIWSIDYLLVDVPLAEGEAKRQVEAELRAYLDLEGAAKHQLSRQPFEEAPLAQTPLITGLNPHLTHWLTMVLPYIRHRLYGSLGIAPGISTEALQKFVQTLLLCRGRLYVTSTHIDLVMQLADISLPVRLAGLDFDPGWLANIGRVVKFHFE